MKPLEVKVKYFFRSAFTRETVGYLPGSVQADLDSVDPGEDAIFLVDDGTDETLCRGNVSALLQYTLFKMYNKNIFRLYAIMIHWPGSQTLWYTQKVCRSSLCQPYCKIRIVGKYKFLSILI